MKDVDDPSRRMDKTMDEMWKTKKCFQHYRPQLCHTSPTSTKFDYSN